jgi:two-component sensor histidine kinase
LDLDHAETLGLRLVSILLQDQLGAQVEIMTEKGVQFTIVMNVS